MSLPHYPDYKDSETRLIGEIPSHWSLKKLKFLLADTTDSIKIGPFGSQLTSDMLTDDGFKVYGQENVIAQDFSRGTRFISPAKYAELSVYTVKPRDVLITMMGTSGRCAIVPDDAVAGVMDSQAAGKRDFGAAGREQHKGAVCELARPVAGTDARHHGCTRCAHNDERSGAQLGADS